MWYVRVRREVRPLIDEAKQHKTAYPAAYEQLRRDPCLLFPPDQHGERRPFAYRLTGPLDDKVCGVRLKNKFRLAFSVRRADDDMHEGIIEVLYVGPRDKRHRPNDVWTIVHDLFGVENPPDEHLKRPCCESGLPEIDQDELDEFLRRLRRLLR